MKRLLSQAADLDRYIDARGWRGCIIGGVANLRWGEPRLTRDVDATVFTGFGNEASYIDAILAEYRPRIADAAAFALANRVVLAQSAEGIPLDIALGGLPFEEEMIGRATRAELAPGVFARTVSAEDLVVLKAFAARDRDWVDVAGISTRQGAALDWDAIFVRLAPLAELKEAPAILTKLHAIRADTR